MKKCNQFFVLIVILLFFGCKRNTGEQQDSPTSGTSRIAVDETFSPIISNEIDVFESIYKTTGVLDTICPEVDAFNLLLNDRVRMIIATRKLNDKELRFFNSKKIFPKEVKIAVDGIALIVHKTNPDTLLTTAAVKNILLGSVTTWDQIDPKSKLGPIKVIFDNTKSSTAEYAVRSICENQQLSDGLSTMTNNAEVIDYVSKTPNALGIIGVSWISNHMDTTCMGFLEKINVIALSNEQIATADNSYQPYQAYLATKQYPYIRDIYAILTEPYVGLASGFTSFITSDRGQRIILKSGILPVTQPLRVIQVKEN